MEGQKEVDEVFGKKSEDAGASEVKNDIYTMPEEFFVPIKVKSRKLLYSIIIIGVLLVVFGGSTAYVLLTQNNGDNVETLVVPDTDLLEVTDPVSPVEEETTVIDQTNPEEVEPPVVTETPGVTPPVEEEKPLLLPASVDLDGDGLTDIEELFLGIDPAVADTDGDGFFDGGEVSAGYDPSIDGANLSDNPLFKEYKNDNPSFTVLMPSSWIEKRILAEADTIEFIAPNKDTFKITVELNSEGATVDTWFSQRYPSRTLKELTNRTIGGRVGKESIIRREVYIPIASYVLVVQYDVKGKKEVAHPGIFEFVLNSISF